MNPTALVSYSHDSDEHKEWVRKVAADLRARGVDVSLDQWDAPPGTDLVRFMEQGVAESDRVVVVCSDNYVAKADQRSGGVGYEATIVSAELFAKLDTTKLIPVIRANTSEPPQVPRSLASRRYIDFRRDVTYTTGLEELARALHEAPAFVKPPLGENPFTGPRRHHHHHHRPSPGSPPAPRLPLEDAWFDSERASAREGLENAGLSAAATMEVRMGVSPSLSRTRGPQLLEAARSAQIHTFGWPIGVVLKNRDDARPQPTADGIRAKIAQKYGNAFDYWSLRANGDFYFLQTLFEEERDPEAIFFNTRIVRTAETLMYGSRLYTHLGAPTGAEVDVRVTHGGFAGRTLKSAGGSRHLFPRKTTVGESSEEVRFALPLDESRLAQHVKDLLSPMFELFDYMDFVGKIYEDIVHRFVQGEERNGTLHNSRSAVKMRH